MLSAVYPEMKIMNNAQPARSSVPSALITWSTAAALIAFGVVLSSQGIIMGRAVLALGILSAANEGLRLRAQRTSFNSNYERFRLVLAVVYVVLISVGLFLFVYMSEMSLPFM